MSSNLPNLDRLPKTVRPAAQLYNAAKAMLEDLHAQYAACSSLSAQENANNQDRAAMLVAINEGRDPVSAGTPAEIARQARVQFTAKAIEAKASDFAALEHSLGRLLLAHREAVIAAVDGDVEPSAVAYRQAIVSLFKARAAHEDAMNLRVWASSIRDAEQVPNYSFEDLGPRLDLGLSHVDATTLRSALLRDADRSIVFRENEAKRATWEAREARLNAVTAAEAAARKVREDAEHAAMLAASQQPQTAA